jgi:hypothetical protein
MNENDPVESYLSRPENLVTALEVQRALKTLDNQGKDALGQPVAQLFSDGTNLRIARAIDQQITRIKRELLESFGLGLRQQLRIMMENSNTGERWELKLAYHEPWTRAYAGWGLYPKMDEDSADAPYLWACIQRTEDYMNSGISRSEKQSTRPLAWDSPAVVELQSRLKRRGLTGGSFWLGYESLYNFGEDDFYLKAAGDLDDLVLEVTNRFWGLFDETREIMEEANRMLSRWTPL